MKIQLTTLFASVAFISTAVAAPQTFDFKDPKGVNNVVFKLDAPLEAINGSASGVSGSVAFDPQNPAATKGRIVVATESLTVPNSSMKEHMHSDKWMDVAGHPAITFDAKELKNVKTSADTTTADAVGQLTVRGVTREITIPVKLTYLKDKLAVRSGNKLQGDLLVIRSSFKIKRNDYGINPKAPEDVVSDDIELTLSIAGAAVK